MVTSQWRLCAARAESREDVHWSPCRGPPWGRPQKPHDPTAAPLPSSSRWVSGGNTSHFPLGFLLHLSTDERCAMAGTTLGMACALTQRFSPPTPALRPGCDRGSRRGGDRVPAVVRAVRRKAPGVDVGSCPAGMRATDIRCSRTP